MPRIIHGLALGAGLLAITMSGQAIADNAKVAAVIKRLDNPFFLYMLPGIDAKAKELGAEVNIQAAAGTGDSTGQADRLSALLR